MKLYLHLAIAAIIILSSCRPSEIPPESQSGPSQLRAVAVDETKIATGQTIYVPVYSHLYYKDQQRILNLAATLSIRNTDLAQPMIITSVRYYDTAGKLVKEYLPRPVQLGALASTDVVIGLRDTSGGSGANFIVEWVAEKEISEPVVEAVMIGTESTQGISFLSPGKVIKSRINHKPLSSHQGS